MDAVNEHISFLAERVTLLPQNDYVQSSMTTIRDAATVGAAFVETFERVAHLLIVTALSLAPTESVTVSTPTGETYQGRRQISSICGVSILRAGASFENALRKAHSGHLSFGQILIQRDEETSLPVHLYTKLPPTISSQEPMLATGGSASKAIEILLSAGVPEENIIFVNLLASQKGLETLLSHFPKLRLVTAAVDEELTASSHVSPGVGDFGDRYYGTIAG